MSKKPTLQLIRSMQTIDRDQWDACANPGVDYLGQDMPYDPFVSYDFLNALEMSHSVSRETGWVPHHLIMANDAGDYYGVVPAYIKSHSRGEFVFDWSWADAFERAGGDYYPKLLVAVPFTPVPGRRLLARPGKEQHDVEQTLLSGCLQVADQLNLSSLHINFPTKEEWERLGKMGFLQRIDQQFHWQNDGYQTFDGFLSTLSSKKRKNIKRERRTTIDHNIQVEHLTGGEITEDHWDALYDFYQDTGSRKWGSPYLNREFFSIIGKSMSNSILLIMCQRKGRYIAGALNFIGGNSLYGRYWGCLEDYPFLHFEVCYYQAIEYAINNQLDRVEAGAQGEHKLARGYLSTPTYSAHWIADDRFRDAVEKYLQSERQHIQQEIYWLNDHSPFRKTT